MAQEAISTAAAAPFHFRLSEDGMQAFVDFDAAPGDATLQLDDFVRVWKAEGFDPEALNPERILEAADVWNQNHQAQHGVLVAAAPQAPASGRDGRLEILVEMKSPAPAESAGGRVDLRKTHSLCLVEKDQVLVRRHPPEKGRAGRDLRGREIAAPDGQDVPLPQGEGLLPSPQDANVLVAGVSGYVAWEGGRLCVRERFVVNGGVDYSTGHIEYGRSVTVQGEVQEGFCVRVGGDLEVAGPVGDAQLTVGGNVMLHGGFVGAGQGCLNAKGEVQVGFVSNQTIRAYRSLTVEKEAFNARLYTKENLIVKGPFVGGGAVAGLRMECKALGNDLGTKTEIELGVDYLDFERREELERKIRELTEALQKMRLRMAHLKDAFQKTRKLIPSAARTLLELRRKCETIATTLPQLEMRKNAVIDRIRQGYYRKGIELKIESRVYPGAVIRVGSQVLRVSEETSGPRHMSYFDNQIHVY